MFAGTLLACDMGGLPLAQELITDPLAAILGGLFTGSMLGATLIFNIPVVMGIVPSADKPATAKGIYLLSAYAYAASEENAVGEKMVTAPTCGASGVLPTVLVCKQQKFGFADEEIISALAVAGIIGNLVKHNASISSAECGCQAEIYPIAIVKPPKADWRAYTVWSVINMQIEALNAKIDRVLSEHSEEIIKIGETVLAMPELGYREKKASQYIRDVLDRLGIPYSYPHAVTGVKATLKGKESRYNVCIIGEMDAVKCAGHKHEGDLSAAHACGHNAQIAAMLGAAIALKNSGIMAELCGDVTLMAVPAEEFIELDYRSQLKSEGKIKHFGGKQQLIYEGAFDDIDIAIMIHAQGEEPHCKLYVRGHNLGFHAKTITYTGKAVHGSTPFDGVNALNAAALSILGIHSNRETFREEEQIRIHPIITKGGDVVNSVPDKVCVDTYVRGATLDAIKKGSAAVERSVSGACQIIGADYSIETIPGYLPLTESEELSAVFEDVAKTVLGEKNLVYGEPITGSSDIGDLSHILPTIQPSIGGFTGALHSTDFKISNQETAYIKAAELMAKTVVALLHDTAQKAEEVKNNFYANMTKAEYIDYLNGRA